jgi:hypothetical protein
MRELMPAIMVEVVQEVLARKCPNGKCAELEPPKPRSS